MKARLITNVTSTSLGKEEMAVHFRIFGTNSLKEGAMYGAEPLLGSDHETKNEITLTDS
jgi:hypothetical protein